MPKLSPEAYGGIYQVKETLCAKIRRQERESCLKRKHSIVWLSHKVQNEVWQEMRLRDQEGSRS